MSETTVVILLFLVIADLTIIVLFMRRILDALHTLIAQGSKRRGWAKEEHGDG